MSPSSDPVRENNKPYRPLLYVVLLAAIAVGVFVYDLKVNGIFACSSAGYSADRYLAYCNSRGYGDYDHGAFWFDLEPEARLAAENADVLFLGTSRLQFALSSEVTRNWFAEDAVTFYLLGFSHSENVTFTAPLLEALAPKARVYVINTDRFFETDETEPAADVFHGDTVASRYRRKRLWQVPHRALCGPLPLLCSNHAGFVRTVADGTWTLQGSDGLEPGPIAAAPPRAEKQIADRVAAAREFLAQLPVESECVLLTVAPSGSTPWDEAAAIAEALGDKLVAPRGEDLRTFDGSHLDRPSAELWSERFFVEAGDKIRGCLAASVGTGEGGSLSAESRQ